MSKVDCLALIAGDMSLSDRLEDLDDWGDVDPNYATNESRERQD